jgi:hypothetical protein
MDSVEDYADQQKPHKGAHLRRLTRAMYGAEIEKIPSLLQLLPANPIADLNKAMLRATFPAGSDSRNLIYRLSGLEALDLEAYQREIEGPLQEGKDDEPSRQPFRGEQNVAVQLFKRGRPIGSGLYTDAEFAEMLPRAVEAVRHRTQRRPTRVEVATECHISKSTLDRYYHRYLRNGNPKIL